MSRRTRGGRSILQRAIGRAQPPSAEPLAVLRDALSRSVVLAASYRILPDGAYQPPCVRGANFGSVEARRLTEEDLSSDATAPLASTSGWVADGRGDVVCVKLVSKLGGRDVYCSPQEKVLVVMEGRVLRKTFLTREDTLEWLVNVMPGLRECWGIPSLVARAGRVEGGRVVYRGSSKEACVIMDGCESLVAAQSNDPRAR
jgi:hypothetical protein